MSKKEHTNDEMEETVDQKTVADNEPQEETAEPAAEQTEADKLQEMGDKSFAMCKEKFTIDIIDGRMMEIMEVKQNEL